MRNEKDKKLNRALLIWGMLSLLLAAASLFAGNFAINWHNVFTVNGMDRRVFLRLRLPRGLMAFTAGAALSLAGSIYQTVFRNPLASPDVIGTASGASAGAAFAIVLMNAGLFGTRLAAFTGSLIAVMACLLLGRLSGRRSTVTILLAGIAVNALCQAVLMFLKYRANSASRLMSIEFWLMGSFSDVTADKFLSLLPPVLIGMAGVFLLRRQINLLSLEDDEAAMLGVNVPLARSAALALSSLITAGIISSCGLISFIGLLPPHMARLRAGTSKPKVWLLSMLMGGSLLILADMAARSFGTSEIPVSVITSFIGAPALLILLVRERRVSHE